MPTKISKKRALLIHMELNMESDANFMNEALRFAKKAYKAEEVPVGAVVVRAGKIIARAYNQVELLKDATAHAEMLALTQAEAAVGDWRLIDCDLYVTKGAVRDVRRSHRAHADSACDFRMRRCPRGRGGHGDESAAESRAQSHLRDHLRDSRTRVRATAAKFLQSETQTD